ncbi:hypothetical protein Adt_45631 [Abeliophyllum distichum]|uniref:Uncharacterized protein n=1 Tax=Abeliophyllum distichum TaxID=126358 RepID=A0ABD1PE77_9LAMI
MKGLMISMYVLDELKEIRESSCEKWCEPAPGTRWKLPSPITTTGVGRDPEPAPPSPKSATGTRPLSQQLVLEETRSQRLDSQSQHLELAGSYHPSPGDFLGKLDKKPLYNLVHIWYAMLHR